jgi:tRNA A37 N6-isopentenylltransferase MiaA
MIPIAVLGLLLVGGTAYYLDVIPGLQTEEAKEVTVAIPGLQSESKSKDLPVAKESTDQPKVQGETTTKEETVGEKVIEEVKSVGNRVLSIQVPSTKRSPAKVPPPAEHPVDGSRVSMKPLPSSEASVEAAVKELESVMEEETSATLAKAHKSIRASFDESLFQDLDQMSAAGLKVRVVQLATEMEERTKWEAVRLKEFLAMKEKETADK